MNSTEMNPDQKSGCPTRSEARAEVLVGMVAESLKGYPEELGKELDAMYGILHVLAGEFAEDRDYRMAMVVESIADLACTFAVYQQFAPKREDPDE
jgi:hypothetical protein